MLFFFRVRDGKHERMWNETVPTAYILGGPEYFISKVISLINSWVLFALRPFTNLWLSWFYLRHRITQGSTINLTCIIKFSPDAPSHTFWHFKDKVINWLYFVICKSFERNSFAGVELWDGTETVAVHRERRNFHELSADQRCDGEWLGKICMCTVQRWSGFNFGARCEW